VHFVVCDWKGEWMIVDMQTFLAAGPFWLWGMRHLGRDTSIAPSRLSDQTPPLRHCE
jgi:hypothetical protein